MISYPAMNPVALQLGPLAVHWYGVMYLIGFAAVYGLARYRIARYHLQWTREQLSDIVFYGALGAVIGGRLFYTLIYNLPAFLANPLVLIQFWNGGMSFHGGVIGVIFVLWLYAKKIRCSFFALTDFVAPLTPIGLGAGRLGNFINGELWGRTTTVPWAMIFPDGGSLPRHPSQLYEFFLEGVVLFIVLWIFSRKPRPVKSVSGLFLLLYGVFRFVSECFREPDTQLGFVFSDWMTMGQILSLPMIIIGVILLFLAYRVNSL